MNNNFLTSIEVEQLFKISKQTLYRWRKNNTIEFIQINSRKILYNKESIEKLLEGGNNE